MSLKEEFPIDRDETFFNPDELGAGDLEFGFVENGAEKVIVVDCVWDTDTIHTRTLPGQQGVVMATVRWFAAVDWFAVRPKPEQIIYHPVNPYRQGYRIVDIVEAESVYEIFLDKLTV